MYVDIPVMHSIFGSESDADVPAMVLRTCTCTSTLQYVLAGTAHTVPYVHTMILCMRNKSLENEQLSHNIRIQN